MNQKLKGSFKSNEIHFGKHVTGPAKGERGVDEEGRGVCVGGHATHTFLPGKIYCGTRFQLNY